jgi:1-aminocyclopropane-1-carboxylate deaminase/D-cysteine desulfhydrase-like pyridoxal-dependent ACC family enzyme
MVPTNNALDIPLFKTYPKLKEYVGHVHLGNFPTPVQKLEKLGALVGAPSLYIKQDNKSGSLFGGNKVRKLEFLLGDAVKNNAKGILTMGFAGSNHTCATAIYAQQLGLSCVCLHLPQMITSYLRRNLLLSQHYGAELHLFRNSGQRDKAIHEINKTFRQTNNMSLYLIPSGGSNELGATGFVNAVFELKEQIQQGLLPEPDYIYVALGSAGTAAGLILGAKAAGLKSTIIPICIEPDDMPKQHEKKLLQLITMTNKTLHRCDESFPLITMTPDQISINYDFIGQGYAYISPEAFDSINLMLTSENIKLEGTYTGKACAAMLNDIVHKGIKDKVILFWNSFGAGEFADIIKDADYTKLPSEYHPYFKIDLQPNDQGV